MIAVIEKGSLLNAVGKPIREPLSALNPIAVFSSSAYRTAQIKLWQGESSVTNPIN
jgi:hypothetical protein